MNQSTDPKPSKDINNGPEIKPYQEYARVFMDARQPEYRDEAITDDLMNQSCQLVANGLQPINKDLDSQLLDREQKKQMILDQSSKLLTGTISSIEAATQEKIPAGQRWILESFLQAGQIVADVQKRWDLQKQRQKSKDGAQIKAIDDMVNKLNIRSVMWQNKVVRTLYNLDNLDNGEEMTKMFWDNFSKCGENMISSENEDFEGLKKGIMGQIAAIELLEDSGWEAYFPIAEQDALEKIDLWIKNGNEVGAVQIKNKGQNMVLRCDPVTRFENTSYGGPDEIKDMNARNRLLTATQNYNIIWQPNGVQVSAYWLELPQPGIDFDQNPSTGKIAVMDRYKKSKVGQRMLRGGSSA